MTPETKSVSLQPHGRGCDYLVVWYVCRKLCVESSRCQ